MVQFLLAFVSLLERERGRISRFCSLAWLEQNTLNLQCLEALHCLLHHRGGSLAKLTKALFTLNVGVILGLPNDNF